MHCEMCCVPKPENPEQPWICSQCTYENAARDSQCSMCQFPQHADVPVSDDVFRQELFGRMEADVQTLQQAQHRQVLRGVEADEQVSDEIFRRQLFGGAGSSRSEALVQDLAVESDEESAEDSEESAVSEESDNESAEESENDSDCESIMGEVIRNIRERDAKERLAQAKQCQSIQCPICFEEMKETDVCALPCSHCFHEACIDKWLTRSSTCPMCRCDVEEDGSDADESVNISL